MLARTGCCGISVSHKRNPSAHLLNAFCFGMSSNLVDGRHLHPGGHFVSQVNNALRCTVPENPDLVSPSTNCWRADIFGVPGPGWPYRSRPASRGRLVAGLDKSAANAIRQDEYSGKRAANASPRRCEQSCRRPKQLPNLTFLPLKSG